MIVSMDGWVSGLRCIGMEFGVSFTKVGLGWDRIGLDIAWLWQVGAYI
jgi:hypothetical protein